MLARLHVSELVGLNETLINFGNEVMVLLVFKGHVLVWCFGGVMFGCFGGVVFGYIGWVLW